MRDGWMKWVSRNGLHGGVERMDLIGEGAKWIWRLMGQVVVWILWGGLRRIIGVVCMGYVYMGGYRMVEKKAVGGKTATQIAIMHVGPWWRTGMHHGISCPPSTFHFLPGTVSSVQDPEFFPFDFWDLWFLKIFSWGTFHDITFIHQKLILILKYSPFGKACSIFKSCEGHLLTRRWSGYHPLVPNLHTIIETTISHT